MKFKKSALVSAMALLALSGCSVKENWEVDKPLEPMRKSNITVYDEVPRNVPVQTERNIITGKPDKPSPYELHKADVIVEDVHAKNIPPKEMMQEVAPADFYNKRIGDIFKVLTNNLNGTSLIYEPNVNAGLIINMRTGKMKLFELMKTIAESVGYYCYYDDRRRAVVVSQLKEMKYYIPAGIFVDRKVDVTLGNAKGDEGNGATGKVDLNADNPAKKLVEALDGLGSKDKIYSFDKDTGLLVLKEHAIYVPEITQFIFDFVQDRSRKFIVEMAIVDVNLDSTRTRTFDLTNLAATFGNFGLNVLSGGSGEALTIRPGFNDTVPNPGGGFNISSVISLINQYSSTEVVDQAKSVVANHSIKYLGNMQSIEYVSSVNANYTGGNSDRLEIETEKETMKDGVQFTARIDAFKNKDYIDVSIAPVLAYGELIRAGEKEGVTFWNKQQQIREMLSTATIRSGDIIITGGLIRDKDQFNRRSDPITEGTIVEMGSKSGVKNKVETLFIVKVTELTDPAQTFNISGGLAKPVAEDRVK